MKTFTSPIQKPKPKAFFNTQRKSASSQPFFQAKLTIGPANDVYEQEADSVAEQVMRMNDAQALQARISSVNVQKKCAECEEEEKAQRKEKVADSAEMEAPSVVNEALQSGGSPLDKSTRTFMENRIGYDFSGVKIHTGPVAAKSASAINALAYTSGSDIVFNKGQYNPGSDSGKKLLAHELTHVVQQQSAVRKKTVQRDEDTCDTMHRVVVDMLSFRGSNRNPYDDLAEANRIFRPCCVQFVPGEGKSVNPTLSDPLMGNDTTFERARCGTDSAEEQALIPEMRRAFNMRGRLHVLYFERINPSARATSHPQYCSSALTLNHVYMTNTGAPRTLAHEFGHILLNGFFHELPADNLMHPSNTATGSNLTPEQCATIRSNI